MSILPYKQYARQRRKLLSEESFKQGMQYTDNPLVDGQIKTLVNFVIEESGDILRPRSGFRAQELSMEVGDWDSSKDYTTEPTTDRKDIYHTMEFTEEDGYSYRQVVTGDFTITTENQNSIIKEGTADLITIYPTNYNFAHGYPAEVAIPDIDGITCLEQNTDYNNSAQYKFFFNCPIKAEIHKQQVSDVRAIASHIGTVMAAEGSKKYYCFRKNVSTGKSKLVFATLKDVEVNFMDSIKHRNMYKWEEITPKNTTALDAPLNMYNMLEDDPYTFTDTYGASTLQLLGIYPTDLSGTQKQTTYINTEYKFRMNYSVNSGATYKVVWEWKEPNSSIWNKIKEESKTFSGTTPPELSINWVSPSSTVMMRVTVYPGSDTNPSQVLVTGFQFTKTGESSDNLEFVKYDLSTCVGMTTWKQRLVVYGPQGARNMLFVSEPNNPAWFPFPKGVDLFDEPILKCVPYLDNLIVFTDNSIIMLTLSEDGDSWSKRTLQKDLNINHSDAHLIQVIKNMVFFKSNNYFYMIVPSATSASGLTIAPISKPITNLLDNFVEEIKDILLDSYDIKTPYTLVNYYNFIDYKQICMNYVFNMDTDRFLNVMLIYNIDDRNWSIHTIESQSIIKPFKIDVSNANILITNAPVKIPYDPLGTDPLTYRISYGFQFLKYTTGENRDFYVFPYIDTTEDNIFDTFDNEVKYRNYQFLDTGYREHESDMDKRYREVIMKLNNFSQVNLTFYTEFSLDGYLRKDDAKYIINQVVDRDDPRFGVITYDRTYSDESGSVLPGSTVLGIDEDDKLAWKLDVSEFPETIFWQSRIPISGRGFVPRLKVINMDEEDYEILNISWAFRTLRAR